MNDNHQEKSEKQIIDEKYINYLKQCLVQNIFESYDAFRKSLMNIPITLNVSNTKCLERALLDVDTGFLWIKEIIASSPLNLTKTLKEKDKN